MFRLCRKQLELFTIYPRIEGLEKSQEYAKEKGRAECMCQGAQFCNSKAERTLTN